jgi:hypothetical protein
MKRSKLPRENGFENSVICSATKGLKNLFSIGGGVLNMRGTTPESEV